jgi:hypothetical protein
MPKDLYFWLAVIAGIFAVAVLAIWRWQKNVSVAVGPVKISTSDRDALGSTADHVAVAKGADVQGSVGEIVGRKGVSGTIGQGPTSVAEQMKVGKDGRIDRIVGVEVGKSK